MLLQRTLLQHQRLNVQRILSSCIVKDAKYYSTNVERKLLKLDNRNLFTRGVLLRNFSTQEEWNNNDYTRDLLPLIFVDKPIMNTPTQIFKILQIKMQIPNFNYYNEFLPGAEQAYLLVSHALARKDYNALENIIDKDLLARVKDRLETINPKALRLLAFEKEELRGRWMMAYTIYQQTDDNGSRKKILTILMLFLHQFGQSNVGKGNPFVLAAQHAVHANLEFTREYYEDNTCSDWNITYLNYCSLVPRSFQPRDP